MSSEKNQEAALSAARKKFLALSLESTRKSYYPQLKQQLDNAVESEEKLQLLLDYLPARIAFVDRHQRYVLANSGYEMFFDRQREEIYGTRIVDVIGEENYRQLLPKINQALAGENVRFEAALKRSDGILRWCDLSYVPYIPNGEEVEGFYIMSLDITEKKEAQREREELETQLLQVQKNQAIGTLAGGIAHDFNNLMMGVQGRASLIETEYAELSGLMEHVRAIEEYVKSASQLTHQLLGFARGGKYSPKPLDICLLLQESARMFGRTHKGLSIRLHGTKSPVVVKGDRTQLEQVFLNMYVNSLQAMDSIGTLLIEVSTVRLSELACRANGLTPGEYVEIAITDDGKGMGEEERKRVFDPFFTTKEKQRGTGLGLASAYGIVKNHEGMITVWSESGKGSRFTVFLPISSDPLPMEQSVAAQAIPGTATILIVDDEEVVVEVGRRMLESLGYKAIIAENGKKALELVATGKEQIDLVILDLIMPELDGSKVFAELRRLRPEIPVLLASGYSLDGQAREIMDQGCNGFIQKPFGIANLSQAINEILRQ
jgi:PAS domain S-box-containing protein